MKTIQNSVLLICLGFILIITSAAYASPYFIDHTNSFSKPSNATGTFSYWETASLHVEPPVPDMKFGTDVAIDGTTVMASAENEEVYGWDNAGAVYVYEFINNDWVLKQKLIDPTPSDGAHFGGTLLLEGDVAMIYAQKRLNSTGYYHGVVYIFRRVNNIWELAQTLYRDDGAVDCFGCDMDIDGDTVVIAASEMGYVYRWDTFEWRLEQTLLPFSDPNVTLQEFGFPVTISEDTIMIGDYCAIVHNMDCRGAVYVYSRNGTTWSEQEIIIADDGLAHDAFGDDISLKGDSVMIGAWHDKIDETGALGSVYVFTWNGSVWEQQQKITIPDGNGFGEVINQLADSAFISQSYDQTNGGHGVIYVFEQHSGIWVERQSLHSSSNSIDYFGGSVDVDINGRMIVGAPEGEVVGADGYYHGMVYFFESIETWGNYLPMIVQN